MSRMNETLWAISNMNETLSRMNEWDPILVNEAYRKWVLSKINECCFVILTRGCGRWARRKRMGFTPAPAALHRNWTRVPRILSFSRWLFLSGSLFPPLFFRFWNQTSPRCETRLFISQKSEIGHNEVCLFSDFGIFGDSFFTLA